MNKGIYHIIYNNFINPLTSPGEGVTEFTSPNLSAGAPALGEAKGLMLLNFILFSLIFKNRL